MPDFLGKLRTKCKEAVKSFLQPVGEESEIAEKYRKESEKFFKTYNEIMDEVADIENFVSEALQFLTDKIIELEEEKKSNALRKTEEPYISRESENGPVE